MFTIDALRRLTGAHADPAVSLLLPTHEAGREIRQDPIRLKNLLAEAGERLARRGLRRPEAEALLAPAAALLEDAEFWRHQDRGLALYVAPDVFERFRVPQPLPETVTVGNRFAVRPLLPLLEADGAFLILVVTSEQVRFYSATRFGLCEEDIQGPHSVAEIEAMTDYDKDVYHAAPPARPRVGRPVGMVKTHNFGEDPEEIQHAQLVEFLRRVSAGVERKLAGGARGPIVLAGDARIQGLMRSLAPHKLPPGRLLDEGLEINPATLTPEELHRRAYAIVGPIFDRARKAAIDHFRSLIGDAAARDRATARVEDAVRAAHWGRVDTLLVVEGERVRGRFDEAANRVVTQTGPGEEGEGDLLELAVAHTLLNGGTVHAVERGDLPPGAVVGAILRYAT